jgi:hypothetical protein
MKITAEEAVSLLPITAQKIRVSNGSLFGEEKPVEEVLKLINANPENLRYWDIRPLLEISPEGSQTIYVEMQPNPSYKKLYQPLLGRKSTQTKKSREFLTRFVEFSYKTFKQEVFEKELIFEDNRINPIEWSFILFEGLNLHCICNNHTGKFMLKVQKGAHELPSRWVDDDISLADFQNEMRDFFHDVLSEPMHELLK